MVVVLQPQPITGGVSYVPCPPLVGLALGLAAVSQRHARLPDVARRQEGGWGATWRHLVPPTSTSAATLAATLEASRPRRQALDSLEGASSFLSMRSTYRMHHENRIMDELPWLYIPIS